MTATTITEVIEQLNEIVLHSLTNNDRAGYFAALYKRVTIAVSDKIKEGYFDDNARMEKLDVVFANFYLDAYKNYKAGQPCSASWKLAFDSTLLWKPMVIQHLLAGMNAHIGLDLGIAAATVSPGESVNSIQNDFNKINEILNQLVNEIKTELYDMWPLSKILSNLNTGKLENEIAGFSMGLARDAAWQVSIDYAPLVTAEDKNRFITERDKKVASFGDQLIFIQSVWLRILQGIARVFEFGSISSKIKKLAP